MIDFNKLSRELKGKYWSKEAKTIVDNLVRNYGLNSDLIIENTMSYTQLQDDEAAWDYLQVNDITDFSSAIRNGCKTINEIACYYLNDEVNDILAECKLREE